MFLPHNTRESSASFKCVSLSGLLCVAGSKEPKCRLAEAKMDSKLSTLLLEARKYKTKLEIYIKVNKIEKQAKRSEGWGRTQRTDKNTDSKCKTREWSSGGKLIAQPTQGRSKTEHTPTGNYQSKTGSNATYAETQTGTDETGKEQTCKHNWADETQSTTKKEGVLTLRMFWWHVCSFFFTLMCQWKRFHCILWHFVSFLFHYVWGFCFR